MNRHAQHHWNRFVLPALAGLILLASLACGSSTDTAATRYNFAVIDGANQASTAGAATLARPITSQLTRDPQGKFAAGVLNFLLPAAAYAQGLTLSGTPVANAIVCGRVAPVGEPQVVPLCAFTLADGKAANVVQGGTKAGTYNVLFTAQVPSQEPVVDSTTVIVEAGAVDPGFHVTGNPIVFSPATIPETAVHDSYGNAVPFVIVGDKNLAVSNGRTLTFDNSTDPNGTTGVAELRDAANILIGHLTYRIYPAGSYPTPGLTWSSAGMNVTP